MFWAFLIIVSVILILNLSVRWWLRYEFRGLEKIFNTEGRMTVDVKYANYLNELNHWAPWTFSKDERSAYAHLRAEFPSLSEAEAKVIVNTWLASGPQLLVE